MLSLHSVREAKRAILERVDSIISDDEDSGGLFDVELSKVSPENAPDTPKRYTNIIQRYYSFEVGLLVTCHMPIGKILSCYVKNIQTPQMIILICKLFKKIIIHCNITSIFILKETFQIRFPSVRR